MRSLMATTLRSATAQASYRVAGRLPALSAVRFYLGQAGEGSENLSVSEQDLLKIAKPKSEEILKNHLRMPRLDRIPPAALDQEAIAKSNLSKEEQELDMRRKRLVYRSKQRGWLEVDLLLGTWASENVANLTVDELDQFEAFVNLETIDIYNVVTLRLDVPEDMKTKDGNGVVERIQAWARTSPLGQADPEKYKSVKTSANLI